MQQKIAHKEAPFNEPTIKCSTTDPESGWFHKRRT